jgi:hypothetical protein
MDPQQLQMLMALMNGSSGAKPGTVPSGAQAGSMPSGISPMQSATTQQTMQMGPMPTSPADYTNPTFRPGMTPGTGRMPNMVAPPPSGPQPGQWNQMDPREMMMRGPSPVITPDQAKMIEQQMMGPQNMQTSRPTNAEMQQMLQHLGSPPYGQ